MMKTNRARKRKRTYFPNLPDHRNVKRGTEGLQRMISAAEQKKPIAEVVDEMQTPLFSSYELEVAQAEAFGKNEG